MDLEEASPQIRSAIDRASRFLNLSALVTILLAAIAVAIAARRYVARHLDTVALMKSMGAPQRLVLQISVLELLMIALLAGIIGTLIGYGAQAGIGLLLKDLVRGELPPPSPDAAWLGIMTAVLMLIGFALPPPAATAPDPTSTSPASQPGTASVAIRDRLRDGAGSAACIAGLVAA